LKASDKVPKIVTAGRESVGLRCPLSDKTPRLIGYQNCPLAAHSANPSGSPSPKSVLQVLCYFDAG
jgi:L-threonylcarbamoyladenylate synthase